MLLTKYVTLAHQCNTMTQVKLLASLAQLSHLAASTQTEFFPFADAKRDTPSILRTMSATNALPLSSTTLLRLFALLVLCILLAVA